MWLTLVATAAACCWSLGRGAFSCVCSPNECEPVSAADCPPGAGTVPDACGCCPVCARVRGEPCGGPHGFHGACAHGLQCVVTDLLNDAAQGVCSVIPGGDVGCGVASGCDIVGVPGSCRCGEGAAPCPGTRPSPSPFTFATAHECRINLALMMRRRRRHDDYDYDHDGGDSTGP